MPVPHILKGRLKKGVIFTFFFIGFLSRLTAAKPETSQTPSNSLKPLYPGAVYNPSVTPPSACLGFEIGQRMARPQQIVNCFRTWAKESPRVKIERAALSHEGRELIRVIIASPEHHKNMDALLANLQILSDPRGISSTKLSSIIDNTPAVAWFGYGIHGDETSGSDASLGFGYLLTAGTHSEVKELLENSIIIIDPVMNPDGRTRIIDQVIQTDGAIASLNFEGFHRGHWPWGRGNHYLFDMNRDWILGSQPETRGRWQGLLKYHPQLMVDAHEMGPNDTFLFYPRAEPVNPNFSPKLKTWTQVFAKDQSASFDTYGWPYYTREWADGWYPGYSDAWGSLQGAIGILYEQAKVWGRPLKTQWGQVVTYRETVHHQAISSLSNLKTLSNHRAAILKDYLEFHQHPLQGPALSLALDPQAIPDRSRDFITTLLRQGIEVWQADQSFTVSFAQSTLGPQKKLRYPKGTYLIDTNQPRGALVKSLLEFDPQFSTTSLQRERARLEQEKTSGIYDITAWNLSMSFGLPAAWISAPKIPRTQVTQAPTHPRHVVEGPAVAWVVSGASDRSVRFAALALQAGLNIRIADTQFAVGKTSYPRGSLLIRTHENSSLTLTHTLSRLAQEAQVSVHPASTARSPDTGPDLGGQHFHQLIPPKIAILANTPTQPADYGHIWHHIDQSLSAPASLLNSTQLNGADLRKYNVLVVPPIFSFAQLKPYAQSIKAWTEAGGTLIAMGENAHIFSQKPFQVTQMRLRSQHLEDLPAHAVLAQRWFESLDVGVDPNAIYSSAPGKPIKPLGSHQPVTQTHDRWLQRFSPQGVFLRAHIHPTHWLTMGVPSEMPLLVRGRHAFLANEAVQVAARLSTEDTLRLSGLLWPEARSRLATTAWATTESVGRGQIVLFYMSPVFRALQKGSARLFSNAVIYGPSLGAQSPSEW